MLSEWSAGPCSVTCGRGLRQYTRSIAVAEAYGGQACAEPDSPERVKQEYCFDVPCDGDCKLTEWTTTQCSATCGGGTKTRSRRIVALPTGNGQACPAANELTVTEACNSDPCPVDCVMSEWKETQCSRTCGKGHKSRWREPIVLPQNGGTPCPTDLFISSIECNVQPCNQDCVVSDWSIVQECPYNCSGGYRILERTIIAQPLGDGAPCGPTQSKAACTSTEFCPVDCQVGSWVDVGVCSVTCGGGLQQQRRSVTVQPLYRGKECPSLVQTVPCNTNPCVLCNVSNWSSWSQCSVSCGIGWQTRERHQLSDVSDASICPKLYEQLTCTTPCPVNCEISQWTPYGSCSKTCGAGLQEERRTVLVEPKNDGLPCPTELVRQSYCNLVNCEKRCYATNWFNSSDCSTTCGVGTITQRRNFVGEDCTEEWETRQTVCVLPACPVDRDCVLSEWTTGACSKSCGHGQYLRTRYIVTEPLGNGKECGPLSLYGSDCNLGGCPVDCEVGDWVDADGNGNGGDDSSSSSSSNNDNGKCSVSCGVGVKRQYLVIKRQAENGGKACPTVTTRTIPCYMQACTGECEVGPWIAQGSCSAPCGGGVQTYVRSVIRNDSFGGRTCPALTKTEPCNTQVCPVDCVVSDWRYTPCSRTCGSGVTFRYRTVILQPVGDGRSCPLLEDPSPIACNTFRCPIDCEVSEWADARPCSVTCGQGSQLQSRTITTQPVNGGMPCPNLERTVACNQDPCHISCVLSDWITDPRGCSATCGGGYLIQSRKILQEPPFNNHDCVQQNRTVSCNTQACPVNCKVSYWNVSACSVSCGGGYATRTRTILQQASNGGADCPVTQDTIECNKNPCPVNCVVSEWSAYTPCSVSCGQGTQSFNRSILVPALNGGDPCPSKLDKVDSCKQPTCPQDCDVSQWHYTTPCSVTCGNGTRTLTRTIRRQPTGNGAPCPGDDELTKVEACYNDECAKPCEMSEWSDYGPCSVTCGAGYSVRTRRVVRDPVNGGTPCGSQVSTATCNKGACSEPCVYSQWIAVTDCLPTIANQPVRCGTGYVNSEQSLLSGNSSCPSKNLKSEQCYLGPCPVDCVLGPWKPLGVCSTTCGVGTQTYQHLVITPAQYGGQACDSTVKIQTCNEQVMCPQDCLLSEWTSSSCSVTCGQGTYTRTRKVLAPAMAGGAACPTNPADLQQTNLVCSLPACPIDCKVSEWTNFGSCSRTCGSGRITQVRTTLVYPSGSGAECPQNNTRTVACNTDDCPVRCEVGPWRQTSPCSVSCGAGGYRSFERSPLNDNCPSNTVLNKQEACDDLPPCPINCNVSDWSWSGFCSLTCGGGLRTRTRRIIQRSNAQGLPCPREDELTSQEPCNEDPCPVDCQMSEWAVYGPCDRTCGGGNQLRVREITRTPQFGGKDCLSTFGSVSCNTFPCPLDCVVSDWSNSTDCSRSCALGTMLQTRKVLRDKQGEGADCPDLSRAVPCNNFTCPGDCEVSEWTSSPCSATCGYATYIRSRDVLKPATNGGRPCPPLIVANQVCNDLPACPKTGPVDCVLSDWSDYTPCSARCGYGTYQRIRKVIIPAKNGGKTCDSLMEERRCNLGDCVPDQDCEVGEWQLGTCSATCGGGVLSRYRFVTKPQIGGGLSCPETAQLVPCNTQYCPVPTQDCRVGDWSEWSACSQQCGGFGKRTRNRPVLQPSLGPGIPCPETTEQKPCALHACSDQDCIVSEWSRWSRCTVECGGGTMYRLRSVMVPAVGQGQSCPDVYERTTCNSHSCDGTYRLGKIKNLYGEVRNLTIVLNWDEVETDSCDRYNIYLADDNNNMRFIAEVPFGKTSYTLTSAPPAEFTYVLIRVANDYTESPESASLSIDALVAETDTGRIAGGPSGSGSGSSSASVPIAIGVAFGCVAVLVAIVALVVIRKRRTAESDMAKSNRIIYGTSRAETSTAKLFAEAVGPRKKAIKTRSEALLTNSSSLLGGDADDLLAAVAATAGGAAGGAGGAGANSANTGTGGSSLEQLYEATEVGKMVNNPVFEPQGVVVRRVKKGKKNAAATEGGVVNNNEYLPMAGVGGGEADYMNAVAAAGGAGASAADAYMQIDDDALAGQYFQVATGYMQVSDVAEGDKPQYMQVSEVPEGAGLNMEYFEVTSRADALGEYFDVGTNRTDEYFQVMPDRGQYVDVADVGGVQYEPIPVSAAARRQQQEQRQQQQQQQQQVGRKNKKKQQQQQRGGEGDDEIYASIKQ